MYGGMLSERSVTSIQIPYRTSMSAKILQRASRTDMLAHHSRNFYSLRNCEPTFSSVRGLIPPPFRQSASSSPLHALYHEGMTE